MKNHNISCIKVGKEHPIIFSTKMHISTKDKALTGLKEAHYFLINQPFKEDGEWEIVELIAKAITKLEKIKPGETDE